MSIEVLKEGLINDSNNLEASLEHVKKYFSDGGDVNQKIDEGKTPLMLAIRHSYNSSIDGYNIDAVKFILNKKPNISVKDEDGEAAIHHAVTWGSPDIVELLIKAGANPNEKDSNGATPLIKAMQVNAKIKTIDVILAHNGDLYAENHNGGTALHEAAGIGRSEILEHLKPKIRDFELRNKIDGTTLLICAAMYDDDFKVMKFLLDNGAKLDSVDNDGKTALMWAVHSDQTKNARFLVEKGANVNLKDKESKRATEMALEKDEENIRNELIQILKK